MSSFASHAPTLIHAGDSLLRKGIVAIIGSLALWVSAKVQVPFFPVPMTMQTLVVLGFAMAAGRQLALCSFGLYLLEGALGMPVFAGGAGLPYMTGPTGGYLFGMFVASGILGHLGERRWDRSPLGTVAAMAIGTMAIYAFGLAWLGTFIGYDQALIEAGLLPFVPGDIFKIALAALLLPGVWRRFTTLRG